MPNGFWYARGETHEFAEAIPSSAFSKGDLLTLDSNSSLSGVDVTFSSSADTVIGVALADSDSSINDRVGYIIPGADTVFWASLQSVDATALVPGLECDVRFAVAENRFYVDPSSANTLMVVLSRGDTGVGAIDQSVQSKVLVRFLTHTGAVLEYS